MKVIVIIPAAGLGTRMASSTATAQGKTPTKQFLTIAGAPILIHTLRKFVACPEITDICIALRPQEAEVFTADLVQYGLEPKRFQVAEGGEHRQQSVSNALRAVIADADDIVLVHDAVRPFVEQQTILDVIEAVKKHGAAIAGMPAVDTIKQVERTADGAIIRATIPREVLVQAQTPQGFRYGILKEAMDEAEMEGFLGTDEASLLERAGQDVYVVMGSPRNIKITTPSDLELAELYLKAKA
ncbi:MAG: 2-C-methyl-D-erythritol 4-phosphate cytidylyltransferase [Terriglobia bacterium]|jgi:2-C-methyl-D-erythritol 4-phosphate cytidylyltransferase|nr:2-C-methyl-D-erythritol 4-phosphate cytidylyltransferase [Terriglobia bacterium]